MATRKLNPGSNTAATVTSLQSLGNNGYWQSASISNATVLGLWLELFITIATPATGSATGYIEVFYAGSTDGGTDFAGGASGTQGPYSTSSSNDPGAMEHLGRFPCDATGATSKKYRIAVPYIGEHFAIVIKNVCGASLSATGNAVEYRLHTETIA